MKSRNKMIPKRWRKPLIKHFNGGMGGKATEDSKPLLHAGDFDCEGVSVEFEDGSHMRFKAAFALFEPTLKEVAIFTEHCGYYFINVWSCRVFVLRNNRRKTLLVNGPHLALEIFRRADANRGLKEK